MKRQRNNIICTCAHKQYIVVLSLKTGYLIVHRYASEPGLERNSGEDRFGEQRGYSVVHQSMTLDEIHSYVGQSSTVIHARARTRFGYLETKRTIISDNEDRKIWP